MNSPSIPEGPGSVSGAPHLPAEFADSFTSRYIDTGGLRQHVVTGSDGPPLLLVHGCGLSGGLQDRLAEVNDQHTIPDRSRPRSSCILRCRLAPKYSPHASPSGMPGARERPFQP